MNNYTLDIDGNNLIITVDLSKECRPSKSGKSIVIASTYGNITIPDTEGVKLGLNVYKKAD